MELLRPIFLFIIAFLIGGWMDLRVRRRAKISVVSPVQNHEIWRTCSHCGEYFDMRSDGFCCPNCGTNNK